jgi:tetratricopeptide (TPR) repeat protein
MIRLRQHLVSAALVTALAVSGCARSRPDASEASPPAGAAHAQGIQPEAACTCPGAPVVDPTLLAFLSKARAAHHQADLVQEDGNLDQAAAVLEPVVALPHPAAPEAAEVVADTYARLADLKSDAGHFDPALHDVEAGLALAQKPSHFRGHLFEMKGVVLERLYHALDASGDVAGAARAKAQAVDAFKTAIDVQDQVINDALSNGGR